MTASSRLIAQESTNESVPMFTAKLSHAFQADHGGHGSSGGGFRLRRRRSCSEPFSPHRVRSCCRSGSLKSCFRALFCAPPSWRRSRSTKPSSRKAPCADWSRTDLQCRNKFLSGPLLRLLWGRNRNSARKGALFTGVRKRAARLLPSIEAQDLVGWRGGKCGFRPDTTAQDPAALDDLAASRAVWTGLLLHRLF